MAKKITRTVKVTTLKIEAPVKTDEGIKVREFDKVILDTPEEKINEALQKEYGVYEVKSVVHEEVKASLLMDQFFKIAEKEVISGEATQLELETENEGE